MLHTYRLYVNDEVRKLPRLVDSGNIDLPCDNPTADRYQRNYSPTRLWGYLQRNIDIHERGLYLSLTASNEPTREGKRWFIHTAYEDSDPESLQDFREISWQSVKDLRFWDTGLRTYTHLYQGRGIQDYSFYVSRCFGYCFLLGLSYDEDDNEQLLFVNFYPTIHHYHQTFMINENEFWRPMADNEDWFVREYPQVDLGELDEAVNLDGGSNSNLDVNDFARAIERAADLVNFLDSEDEEDEDE